MRLEFVFYKFILRLLCNYIVVMYSNIFKGQGSDIFMAKGLIKKIAKAVGYYGSAFAVGVMGMILLQGPEYEIDGSKVRDGGTRLNQIVEYKEKDKIRYVTSSFRGDELFKVFINGKKYTQKDTLVYEEANKRYNYLYSEIQSREEAKHDLKVHNKLEKEAKEVEEALEIVRK